MERLSRDIQIISAPSILGLKPTGVDLLGKSLLDCGLATKIGIDHPVIHVGAPNHLYSAQRDADSYCLNTNAIRNFSVALFDKVSEVLDKDQFAVVLGGDCSILLGIMPALKAEGAPGLIFLDAHADFYEPAKSVTGEVADMDLAIVSGRGPEILTNLNNLAPYVADENIIHLGQRDQEEAKHYGSQDIRKTNITCFALTDIEKTGVQGLSTQIRQHFDKSPVDDIWIHFDTDVLSDEINPAVDYRLPGGLQLNEAEQILAGLLTIPKVAGISITIFNPLLDQDGHIAKTLTESLGRIF